VKWRKRIVFVFAPWAFAGCSPPVGRSEPPDPTVDPRAEGCLRLATDSLPSCEELPQPPNGSNDADGMFAVDAENLYYAQSYGSIFVEPRALGEARRTIESAKNPLELALDATSVYSTGDALVSTSKSGAAVTTLFQGQTGAVVVDEGVVYFTAGSPESPAELWRWTSSEGSERIGEIGGDARDMSLLVEDGYAYVLEFHRLSRVSTVTGEHSVVVSNIDQARGFSKFGDFIYFTEEGTHSVERVTLDGSELVTLSTFFGLPRKLDTDGSNLYITLVDVDPATHRAGARAVRLSMDGVAACSLACAPPYAAFFVLNGERLYY
jgi:hypothetical protein